jgi:transposase
MPEKIKAKKRHVLVDTEGLLLFAILHVAGIQDRDGGILLMAALLTAYPKRLKLYADGGYLGPKFLQALNKIRKKLKLKS